MDRPLATERGLSDTPTLVASQGASSADKRTPLIGRKLSEPPTAGTGDYDDNAAKCGCKSGRTSRRCVCKLREDDARVAWKERAKAAADEGWAECSRRLHKRNKDMVGAWKEEIDTLLVFAGLFSAVLTAFNVGLFMSLNPDPGVDLTNHILLQISAQLSNLSIEGNSIRSSALFPPPNPKASASSIWINALWFSSLVCSLASATVGILVRQWLNYFLSKSSSQPRKSAYIHCLRYDRGLVAWRVPEILGTLPILLLIALVLFLVGLVILLWTLNNIVAGITTGLVAPLLIFLAVTTVAPAFNVDCPYKSPQALPIFWLFQDLRVSYGVRLAKAWIHRGRPRREQGVHTQSLRGRLWSRVSGRPRGPTVVENNRAMTADGNLADLELGQGRVARGWGKPWAAWKKTMDDFVERRGPKKTRPYGGWIEQEQAVVTDDNDILLSPELKEWLAVNVLSCADAYLVDDSFLDCVIAPCILDPEKKTSTALESLRAIMHGNRFRSLRTGQSLAALAVDLVDKILAGNKDSHDIEMFANSFSDYIAKHAAELWERAAANCARLLTCDPTYPDSTSGINNKSVVPLLTDIVSQNWVKSVSLSLSRRNVQPMDGMHHNIEFLLHNVPDFMPSSGHSVEEIKRALMTAFAALVLTTLVNKDCYRRHLQEDVRSLKDRLWEYATMKEDAFPTDTVGFRQMDILSNLFWAVARIARYCDDSELSDWLERSVRKELPAKLEIYMSYANGQ